MCKKKLIQAVTIIFLFIFFRSLYNRYMPTYKVEELDIHQVIERKELTVLDIRDFNVSSNDPVPSAVNIPYSYLDRYHHELGSNSVVVISPDTVGKNMTTRFLKRKGYSVIGFHIKEYPFEHSLFKFNKDKEEVAS